MFLWRSEINLLVECVLQEVVVLHFILVCVFGVIQNNCDV